MTSTNLTTLTQVPIGLTPPNKFPILYILKRPNSKSFLSAFDIDCCSCHFFLPKIKRNPPTRDCIPKTSHLGLSSSASWFPRSNSRCDDNWKTVWNLSNAWLNNSSIQEQCINFGTFGHSLKSIRLQWLRCRWNSYHLGCPINMKFNSHNSPWFREIVKLTKFPNFFEEFIYLHLLD